MISTVFVEFIINVFTTFIWYENFDQFLCLLFNFMFLKFLNVDNVLDFFFKKCTQVFLLESLIKVMRINWWRRAKCPCVSPPMCLSLLFETFEGSTSVTTYLPCISCKLWLHLLSTFACLSPCLFHSLCITQMIMQVCQPPMLDIGLILVCITTCLLLLPMLKQFVWMI